MLMNYTFNEFAPTKFWARYDDLHRHLHIDCNFRKYNIVRHKFFDNYCVVVDDNTVIDTGCLSVLFVVDLDTKSIEDVFVMKYNEPLLVEQVDMKKFLENHNEYELVEFDRTSVELMFSTINYCVYSPAGMF